MYHIFTNTIYEKHLILFLSVIAFAAQSHSQNLNLNLVGQLSYGSEELSNIWGWTDTADGKEYALVGAADGLSIVDVSTPASPVEIVKIPVPASSQGCTWREVKTWGNYAYVTTECGTMGLQIVELTNLPATNLNVATWKPVINGDTLETIHALHADNGKVYLYGCNVGNGGVIIADVVTNPMVPVYLGSYDLKYIHDGMVLDDTLYAGHIYDGECAIVDCSNPASPNLLASFQTPTKFTHNTWLSSDRKFCFTTDENADSYLGAFDISNLGNISETDRMQTNPGSGAVVHNTYVIQKGGADYAVTSWYTEGLTITDVSRPHNLVQVANYDTYTGPSGGFNGCWGVYPYFPSGTIVASDIQTGLKVFAPNYVRGSYLEGTVTNCSTSAPVSGVNVTLQLANPNSNGHWDITDFQGKYEVGVAVPDTYLVVFSKMGFFSDTDTVVLASSVVNIHNVQLCPLPTFSFTGLIFDNSTSAGIPNAKVSIYNSLIRWDTVTNASGNFTIPNMFSGTYSIASGKWLYKTGCVSGQNITSSTGAFSMGLNKQIYDDFIWDYGWTVSGNASSGIWERGEPLGTFDFNNQPVNPDNDITSDCGLDCYVTGNKGTSASDDDVDGGTTLLTSPVFDLSSYTEPYVFYSRWKRISFNSSDTVIIKISNGNTTATLENLTASSSGNATWVNRNYKISNYVTPTANMTFIIQASDLGNDNTNEAALDKFYILDSTGNGMNEFANGVKVQVSPNPFSETATLRIINLPGWQAGGLITDYELKVYDMFGRQINIETIRNPDSFVICRESEVAGIYFYRIVSSERGVIASGKIFIE